MHGTQQHILGHLWVPMVTATAAAIGSSVIASHKQVSWQTVLWVGLLSGLGVYVAVVFVFAVGHLARYKLGGHVHRSWELTGQVNAGNAVTFALEKRPGTMPTTYADFGLMQCRVVTPSEEVIVVNDAEMQTYGFYRVSVMVVGPREEGTYRVRWYGSRRQGGFFYEIARGSFVSDPVPAQ
jgi:hypothetical protein